MAVPFQVGPMEPTDPWVRLVPSLVKSIVESKREYLELAVAAACRASDRRTGESAAATAERQTPFLRLFFFALVDPNAVPHTTVVHKQTSFLFFLLVGRFLRRSPDQIAWLLTVISTRSANIVFEVIEGVRATNPMEKITTRLLRPDCDIFLTEMVKGFFNDTPSATADPQELLWSRLNVEEKALACEYAVNLAAVWALFNDTLVPSANALLAVTLDNLERGDDLQKYLYEECILDSVANGPLTGNRAKNETLLHFLRGIRPGFRLDIDARVGRQLQTRGKEVERSRKRSSARAREDPALVTTTANIASPPATRAAKARAIAAHPSDSDSISEEELNTRAAAAQRPQRQKPAERSIFRTMTVRQKAAAVNVWNAIFLMNTATDRAPSRRDYDFADYWMFCVVKTLPSAKLSIAHIVDRMHGKIHKGYIPNAAVDEQFVRNALDSMDCAVVDDFVIGYKEKLDSKRTPRSYSSTEYTFCVQQLPDDCFAGHADALAEYMFARSRYSDIHQPRADMPQAEEMPPEGTLPIATQPMDIDDFDLAHIETLL
eukprot:c2037_g1_i1.p1 GENE.c2037_g1_i1~~c2037_g1_i1.p1  ORF type:complete len:547 (+),score=55.58 c2037_g1_i1:225-1865(+)